MQASLQRKTPRPGPRSYFFNGLFGAFSSEFAQSSTNPTKPQHHPDYAQRGGGPCAPGARKALQRDLGALALGASRAGPELQHSVPPAFISPSSSHPLPRTTGPARTGTPPDASLRWSYNYNSVKVRQAGSAYLRRSAAPLSPLPHRALSVSSAEASENNPPPPLSRCWRERSPDSVFPVNAVRFSLSLFRRLLCTPPPPLSPFFSLVRTSAHSR